MRTYKCRRKKAIWQVFSILIVVALLALICPLPAFCQADNGSDALRQIGRVFAKIAKEASPSVVQIQGERTVSPSNPKSSKWPFDDFFKHYKHDFDYYYFYPYPLEPPLFGRRSQPRAVAQGCGFIVSQNGYILTAEFVVGRADKIKVKLADRREFEAKVIGTDRETGIAVLKINADKLPFLELGDSDALQVGDWVVAVSSPFGPGHPFASGMVTAKGRSGLGFVGYEDFIQTDAAITLGSGGGPLLNLEGYVVGINCAIVARAQSERVSFAISINMARFAYEQLVEHGKIQRGFLGVSIQDVNADMAKALGLKDAVVVTDVIEDSAAEKAGIRRNDVIVELNGQPLKSANELRTRIAVRKPGTQIEVIVLRDGKQVTFTVTLGTRPLKSN